VGEMAVSPVTLSAEEAAAGRMAKTSPSALGDLCHPRARDAEREGDVAAILAEENAAKRLVLRGRERKQGLMKRIVMLTLLVRLFGR